MNWAMKFLLLRYRERISEFFGKRGKSWHVGAVITRRIAGKLEVECFVHIFESCTQNSFAVASIIENLLAKIKRENIPRWTVHFSDLTTQAVTTVVRYF